MTTVADTCAACFFFGQQTVQDSASGPMLHQVCKRFAPAVSTPSSPSALWPRVLADDWCGDFLTTYAVPLRWEDSVIRSITAESGTLTIAQDDGTRIATLGKAMFVHVDIWVGINGTGAVSVNAVLPVAALQDTTFFGRKGPISLINLGLVKGVVTAGSRILKIVNYDNTYPAVDDTELILHGVLELA